MADSRRVRLTKKMLKDAIVELLDSRPLEKITVTDLCTLADVNRSTFYAYYEEIGQLLREIEDDALAPPAAPEPYSDDRFLATLEEFFDYVQRNERLFRVLLIQREDSSFNQRLLDFALARYQKTSPIGNALMDRYTYSFCINGVIGMMKEWITGHFPVSSREFAALVLHMCTNAVP